MVESNVTFFILWVSSRVGIVNPVWANLRADGSSMMAAYCRLDGSVIWYRCSESLPSLILHRKNEVKPTLIVCPLASMSHWEYEICKATFRGSLKVFTFHGESRSRVAELERYDILLTTYNT